jgi:hypothetical protein
MAASVRERVRFEEWVKETWPVAVLSYEPGDLLRENELEFRDGYDDLDNLVFAVLPLTSAKSKEQVALVRHENSPNPGTEVCLIPGERDVALKVAKVLNLLHLEANELLWIHPDYSEELQRRTKNIYSTCESVFKEAVRKIKPNRKRANRPLVGAELLQKIDKIQESSKKEIARDCGYVTRTKNGQERINLVKFYNAILEAKGIELDAITTASSSHQGQSLSYRASVRKNGTLIIGAGYTRQLNLEVGDEIEIKLLGDKNIQLQRAE